MLGPLEVLGDGGPLVVLEPAIGAGILHLLHPTRLEGMEGVLRPTEFEEDDPEGDVCPQLDVWEFVEPSQDHIRGPVVVGGDAPLGITTAVHPERIQTQRRA